MFLTTPNRWFPVEVHTRLPLVHWLPESAAGRAYDLARKPWAKDNHLLGPAELRALLPNGAAEEVYSAPVLVASRPVLALLMARFGPSLDATRYVIEQLKHRVPIWKLELYADGTREWVGAHSAAEAPAQ